MKKCILSLLLLAALVIPVRAEQITAPQAPSQAQTLLPSERSDFGTDLMYILRAACAQLMPHITSCLRRCASVLVVALLLSFLRAVHSTAADAAAFAGAVVTACLLLEPTNALVTDAVETVRELSDYGKLLLPAMTAALAAQGSVTTAGGLYAATALFDAVLSNVLCKLLTPMVYIFLALSVAGAASAQELLQNLKQSILSLAGKSLRAALYIFTGYLSITGVVSGTADQMSVKAAKLTISGMVPVVGSIMADASETILVSAGLVKSTVGVYGLLTLVAIGIGPFLRIGVQYLALKLLTSLCAVFTGRQVTQIVSDFAAAMGLLLAATGTMCLLFFVSTICFMKGVGG